MKTEKGFTFVEIVIAIVIVGVLSVISAQTYHLYIEKGIATEAKVLLAEINAAEQIYYSRNGSFYNTTTDKDKDQLILGVNAKKNKYFTSYDVTSDEDDNFIVVTKYKDGSLTLNGSLTGEPEIIDNFSKGN